MCAPGYYRSSYALQDIFQHRLLTRLRPSLQTLECIQKVKAALSQQEEEDSMSSATFGILVAASLVVVLGIVVVW